ncbi:MAG: CehA/McbA family metallohydrolase [Vicinamibacteraceae bacterium]
MLSCRSSLALLLVLPALWLAASRAAAQPTDAATQAEPSLKWYKGNTHTHTLNSDGDSTPDDVVRWYREHDYQFLVLTDHNFLTSVAALNALHGADEQFLVLKGEEVTDHFGEMPLHVNGLDVSARVEPQGGSSVVEVLQRNVDAIRRVDGIPHINHPSFRWAITADQLRQVRDNRLFEVYNGHPGVNNVGGGGIPGLEAAWDSILTSGTLLYGIAVDDAHVFKDPGNPNVAGPGRGWVVVRAPRLEARAIVEALDRGDFYASTGVELIDYRATREQINVSVKEREDAKYRIQFIGKGGRLLHEASEPNATYEIRGDEGYVRAKVIESTGNVAWCQPVLVGSVSSASAGAPHLLPILLLTIGAGVWRWRALAT